MFTDQHFAGLMTQKSKIQFFFWLGMMRGGMMFVARRMRLHFVFYEVMQLGASLNGVKSTVEMMKQKSCC